MQRDLRDLREALGGKRWELVLKPVVIATVVTNGSFASGLGMRAALTMGAAATFGSDWKEIAVASISTASSARRWHRIRWPTCIRYPTPIDA